MWLVWQGRAWAVVGAFLAGAIVALMVFGGPASGTPPAKTAVRASFTTWSGGSDPGLHVIPFPGTPDASPITQIIFSALAPAQLRSVSVIGSLTGRHAGRIIALPDGSGAAFVPDQPFATSEAVKVRAMLSSRAAGTASGAPGARELRFSFGVAAPVTRPGLARNAPVPASAGSAITAVRAKPMAAPVGSAITAPAAQAVSTAAAKTGSQPPPPPSAQTAGNYPPSQHFHTYSGLGPPIIRSTKDADHRSGDIFLTPGNGRQHGPTIINGKGQLVWFDHITNRVDVSNLEVKTYQGKPVLTWWEGKFAGGHGIDGRGVIMNSSYKILKEVRAGDGYTSDLHEFQVTPQGTAYVDCYVPVRYNLTSQGGSPNGTVLDGVVEKIDIHTGRVLWEWHALGHVPITASYIGANGNGPYDYFHINSIEQLPHGKVLISGRNTWAAYLVDERTGRIDWTLGGKSSSFHFGSGAGFEWQHHVTLHRNGLLTVFDDAAVPSYESSSSAKLLRINTHARTATLVRRDTHYPPVVATYMGSAQLLPNHDMFVGWGNTDNFSEYSASGHQLYNGSFLGGINTYRAYRFRWTGEPTAPPELAISPGPDGAMKVYSALNGATQIAHWRVLGGASPKSLGGLSQAADQGFETGQWVHGEPRFFAVEGLDAHGRVLGRSEVMRRPANVAVYGQQAFVSASTGAGELPVTCFTVHSKGCSVKATITAGKTVVAQTPREPFSADQAGLLRFHLTGNGRRMLSGAHSHQLSVHVNGSDSSGHSAGRNLKLIQVTTRGAGPSRSTSPSPTIRLFGTTDFSTSAGAGAILSVCYAAIRCYVQGTLSSGGAKIATISPQNLGANDVGYLAFGLTRAGRSMLAKAHGNQLPVQVRLSNGGDVATGQVALVRYG